jgi:hippurate hydrolase
MKLSVRALDAGVRALLQDRITALANAQARAYGCTAEIDYEPGYPVLVNHARPSAFATEVAVKTLGAQGAEPAGKPLMDSEAFAFMLEACPGTYAWIGGRRSGRNDHAAARTGARQRRGFYASWQFAS